MRKTPVKPKPISPIKAKQPVDRKDTIIQMLADTIKREKANADLWLKIKQNQVDELIKLCGNFKEALTKKEQEVMHLICKIEVFEKTGLILPNEHDRNEQIIAELKKEFN